MTRFNRIHTANRGYSTYRAEGFPGVILLAKPAFNGTHPDFIDVDGVPMPTVTPKAARAPKMSKEERKQFAELRRAELKAMTPEQRAAEGVKRANEKFEKAQERARKANEKAAKLAPAVQ